MQLTIVVKDGHGGNDTHSEQIHTYLMEMNQNTYGKSEQILTVGETGGATVEMAQQYSDPESQELSMIFQFELMGIDGIRSGNWDPKPYTLPQLKQLFEKWQTGLEEKGWNSLFWGNHDFPRVVSRFGNDREPYREKSAKMLAICLHMMQGTPYIYQGEELGMTNVPFNSLDDYRDIETFNSYKQLVEIEKSVSHEDMLRYMRKSSRDNARTPMQWNKEKNAGFSEHIPWIMMNPNYQTINAEAEMKDTNSIFHTYQKLIQLRKEYEIITLGKYELIMKNDENIYAYKRLYQNEELYVYCNFTDKEVSYDASIFK